MLACTDIFARPSIGAAARKRIKRQSRYDFVQGKIPSIFNHEVKMLACKGIFTRPSMSHRAAICRTGGAPPPILVMRQVSWEYYTTKRKCVLARTFSRGRQCHIVRQSAADTCHAASIMGILYHEAKMCARTDIFTRPSMSHRAATCRTGGAPPPILAMRQVSCEHYNIPPTLLQVIFALQQPLRTRYCQ